MVLQEAPLHEGHISTLEEKMFVQKFSELVTELEIRAGSKNIIENGKSHGKLLKLKKSNLVWCHKGALRK